MDGRFIITRFTDDKNRWALEDTKFGVIYEYVGANLEPDNILTKKKGLFEGEKGHRLMLDLGVEAIQFIVKHHEEIFSLSNIAGPGKAKKENKYTNTTGMTQKYPGCWYCDNILDHPEQIGLLYLGFPRCFVLIPSSMNFQFTTYDEFLSGMVKVNWLDPSDKGTPEEQEEVLRTLWNFSVEQEAEEERINDENGWAMP